MRDLAPSAESIDSDGSLQANEKIMELPMASALIKKNLRNPFAYYGPHRDSEGVLIRTFQPNALAVYACLCNASDQRIELKKIDAAGIFAAAIPSGQGKLDSYVLEIIWEAGNGEKHIQITEDPYSFDLLLSELDLHLIAEGRHRELNRCLGALPMNVNGVEGTRFAVWAPNASSVSVVGDFNAWNAQRHPMRLRQSAGVWELFIPRISTGERYKYAIRDRGDRLIPLKADPVARASELPPATASVIAAAQAFEWSDEAWMKARVELPPCSSPLSIYEVHAGSWNRVAKDGNRNLNWQELGDSLIPYVREMGFTHIEFLPIMEHPFSGSWGYQPLSQFAPSARFGKPHEFAKFVDRCHNASLGVILDWVPAHFPSDAHGLAQFDGTALYEHADPREGFHQDWNTLIYNFGRNEVRGFLIASALEWLEHFHVDGLRVDAVASMLYRDYSRKSGEWIPNVFGGRENLEAVAFLKELNEATSTRCPGTLMIAEESTSWPGVTAALKNQGLGFSYKWNMGWMHDTLRYIAYDPVHRRHHHRDMTFGMIYAYSEHFLLPISHDEVVHGKGSLYQKMPGDEWQKLANLRAYFGFMWTHPGKKLLFMGCEFAQRGEWNHDTILEWEMLEDAGHFGIQKLVRDLNRLYVSEPALHESDCQPSGFRWLIGDDASNSVFSFLRISPNAPTLLVVCNMTPIPRHHYRIGVPELDGDVTKNGNWEEILNTDAAVYGGSNVGNSGTINISKKASHGQAGSITLTLPPLSTLILRKN